MSAHRFLLIACVCLTASSAPAQDAAPPREYGAEARPMKHAKAIDGLALIDGGKTIVATDHQTLIFWDRASGREIRRFKNDVENGWFGGVLASRDEKVLITTMDGTTVQVRKADGAVIRSWEAPAGHGSLLSLTPDGKRLATLGSSGPRDQEKYFVELWNVETGKSERTIDLKDCRDRPASLALSPDGKTVATSGPTPQFSSNKDPDTAIRVWNVETGKLVKELAGHDKWIYQLVYSDDGKYLVVAGSHETRIWDAAAGKLLHRIDGYYNAAFAARSSLFASGHYIPRVFDAATGKVVTSFPQSGGWVHHVAFTPDGATLVTGDDQGVVRVWDVATGQDRQTARRLSVTKLAFSPDGRHFLVGSTDPRIGMWNTDTGNRERLLDVEGDPGTRTPTLGMRFTPDGKHFLAGNEWGRVTLWSTATGLRVREIQAQTACLTSLDIDASGTLLVTTGWDDEVRIHDLATGARVHAIREAGNMAAAISPDGKLIASLHSESRIDQETAIHLWDAKTGTRLRKLGPFDGYFGRENRRIFFSADGTLYTFERFGLAQWDTTTGREIRTYQVPFRWRKADLITHALSADGQFLAVTTKTDIYIHETTSGGLVHAIAREASALAFSPDGRHLLVGATDGSVTLWPVNPHPNRAALSADDFGRHWGDLASLDAKAAYQASWRLIDAGDQALPIVAERLTPAEERNPRDIPGLLEKLGDADGKVRDDSKRRLQDFGAPAEEPLYEALQGKLPIETRKQVELILAFINEHPRAGVDLQRHRAVQFLERLGTPTARKLLGKVAQGPSASPITAHAGAALARLQIRHDLPVIEVLSDDRVAEMRQHLPGTRTPMHLAKNVKDSFVVYSPDGRWLATQIAGSIRLFDAAAGKPHKTHDTGSGRVVALAFLPDSRRLVFAGSDNAIGRWDFLDGGKVGLLGKQKKEPVVCLAVSPDGAWLASGTSSGQVAIRPSVGGPVTQRINAQVDAVTALAFTPDSQAVLVAGMDKKTLDFDGELKFQQSAPIRQWSIATGKLVRKLDLQGTHLAFSNDRRLLIVSGNVRSFKEDPAAFQGLGIGCGDGFICIDGTLFTDAVTVTHWDWQEGRVIRQLKSKGCLHAVSADGRWVLSGGFHDRHIDQTVEWATNTVTAGPHGHHDPRLHLWEAATGQEVLRGPSKYPAALAIAPDCRSLAWVDGLDNVRLWHLSPAKPPDSAPNVEALWNDLASRDAEKAWQAQWVLQRHPKETLARLQRGLRPAPREHDEHIAELVNQLRSEQFKVRDAATRELQKLGSPAEAALEAALKKEPTLESRRRMQALLDHFRAKPIPAEELRQVRAVGVLRGLDDAEARALLEALGRGSVLSRQTRAARAALEHLPR